MECLSGSCSSGGEIAKAIASEVVAPWVIVTVSGNGSKITVGNESAPSFNNRAVIQAFQYGQSNGSGCTIEIIDEEGGAFDKFFKKVVSDLATANEKYVLKVQWGWTSSSCYSISQNLPKSKEHYFLITNVSIHIESNIKFILEGTDLMINSFDGRMNKIYGGSKKPMPLKDAIREVCKDASPSIKNVKFLRKNPGGPPSEWEFNGNPQAVWPTMDRTLMSIIHEWISRYNTNKDKGITLAWDDTDPQGTLVLWEFSKDDIKAKKTYIVNGGECSPVIEFTTNIKWSFTNSANVGGNADGKGSAANTINSDYSGAKTDKEKQVGVSIHKPTSEDKIRNQGSKEAAADTAKKNIINTRANTNYESIRGELRIQGDPTLDDPMENRFFKVGLVVINPFNLSGDGCPEWLSTSTCNETLSSQQWEASGVVHDIRQGSYTVSLQLFLPPQNSSGDTTLPK